MISNVDLDGEQGERAGLLLHRHAFLQFFKPVQDDSQFERGRFAFDAELFKGKKP